MLTTDRIHRAWSLEDIFGDGQWCPYCHSVEFTHVEGSGITCDRCNAEFRLRMTAGDPGVVVDAIPAETKYVTVHQKLSIDRPRTQGRCSCWQVLKECERGLDDRDRWCSPFKSEVEGRSGFYLTQSDPPLGKEIFCFQAYDVGKVLAREKWLAETDAGREAAALRAKGVYEYDWPKEITDAHWSYLWGTNGMNKKMAKELEIEHLDGYYFEEQCERVFDDCYFIHRCIPRSGETPALTKLGWREE